MLTISTRIGRNKILCFTLFYTFSLSHSRSLSFSIILFHSLSIFSLSPPLYLYHSLSLSFLPSPFLFRPNVDSTANVLGVDCCFTFKICAMYEYLTYWNRIYCMKFIEWIASGANKFIDKSNATEKYIWLNICGIIGFEWRCEWAFAIAADISIIFAVVVVVATASAVHKCWLRHEIEVHITSSQLIVFHNPSPPASLTNFLKFNSKWKIFRWFAFAVMQNTFARIKGIDSLDLIIG